MKIQFPSIQKTQYVSLKPGGFLIQGKTHRKIEGFILEITPARKLFKGRNLECYSNDAQAGSQGQKCAICRKQYKCHPRMRLTISIENIGELPETVILEININSFQSLEDMLIHVEEEELSKTLVKITVNSSDKNLKVIFNTIF